MSSVGYENLLNNQPPAAYAATAYNTSTTLTDVSAPAQYTVAKGALFPGALIEFEGAGFFSNTATPTLLLGVYWGGVAGTKLAATTTITTITGATSWPFRIRGRITVRATGLASVSTLICTGEVLMPASLTQFQAAYPLDAAAIATVSVDTTTAKDITLGAQWGTNSASNTLTVQQWYVKGVNV